MLQFERNERDEIKKDEKNHKMTLIIETNAHDSDGIKRRRYNQNIQNDPKDHGYPPPSIILTLTHYISNIWAHLKNNVSIFYAILTSE
jgi:outer membrane cobalamin receptor